MPSAGHSDGPAQRKAVQETLHFPERTWLQLAMAMPGKSVANRGQYFQGEEFTRPQRKWRIYRPESHPGAQLRGGRGARGEIFREAVYPARSGHER